MPMIEDLSAFFNVDEHATEVVLDNVMVRGIFERPYEEFGDGVATSMPNFTLPTADAHWAKQNSVLLIEVDGVHSRYRVRSIEPDGTGVTRLGLELQP